MPDESDKLKRWAEMFGVAIALVSCSALAYSAYSAYAPTTDAFFLAKPNLLADSEKNDMELKIPEVSVGNCFARPTTSDAERKGFVAYEVDCSGNKTNLTVDMRSTLFSK